MYSVQPKTAEEYVRLVEQALIEIDELRACFEFDMEDAGGQLGYLEPLEQGLKELRASMADGSYHFENRDLAFMEIANKYKSQLPFAHLLAVINHTHRNGLAVDEA
ncbi:hypothetical protein [Thiohalomonas denitrificans]|uniref:General secretion pathway protein GspF n=1 Tax=Thiohalomonas denitrificans TaxID=415747 RepID=A0A1G5Q3D5_9GAMM|nr:hypothetical protein [Thiohalomonas denitrificans]SCZ56374.1 hypothetical protein SAMN03097708_01346 [Thiohalomonas denitrificans]